MEHAGNATPFPLKINDNGLCPAQNSADFNNCNLMLTMLSDN